MQSLSPEKAGYLQSSITTSSGHRLGQLIYCGSRALVSPAVRLSRECIRLDSTGSSRLKRRYISSTPFDLEIHSATKRPSGRLCHLTTTRGRPRKARALPERKNEVSMTSAPLWPDVMACDWPQLSPDFVLPSAGRTIRGRQMYRPPSPPLRNYYLRRTVISVVYDGSFGI